MANTHSQLSTALLTFALSSGTVACGDDDGAAGGLPPGCPSFARIVAVGFERTGETSEWTLQVAGMPALFTLNQRGLGNNVLEYRWGVELDADEDGETDVSVSLSHFKSGEERVVTDVLANMSRDVWEHDGPLSSTAAHPAVTLSGSTFTFTTDDGMSGDLAAVTKRSQVTWVTSYRDGHLICEDLRR